jgi:hypothetical protein
MAMMAVRSHGDAEYVEEFRQLDQNGPYTRRSAATLHQLADRVLCCFGVSRGNGLTLLPALPPKLRVNVPLMGDWLWYK